MRILVVDNYDSFVYNLVQYLGQLGAETVVRRNDEVTADDARGFDGVLHQPGPGTPETAGVSVAMVRRVRASAGCRCSGCASATRRSAVAFGATVTRAPELLHGKTSEVHHTGAGVLAGLPNPLTATRYHSLAIDRGRPAGRARGDGRTESGVIMAMRHRELPIEGVQFHPESVLTEGGHLMLANWLAVCGDVRPLGTGPGARRRDRRVSAHAAFS